MWYCTAVWWRVSSLFSSHDFSVSIIQFTIVIKTLYSIFLVFKICVFCISQLHYNSKLSFSFSKRCTVWNVFFINDFFLEKAHFNQLRRQYENFGYFFFFFAVRILIWDHAPISWLDMIFHFFIFQSLQCYVLMVLKLNFRLTRSDNS